MFREINILQWKERLNKWKRVQTFTYIHAWAEFVVTDQLFVVHSKKNLFRFSLWTKTDLTCGTEHTDDDILRAHITRYRIFTTKHNFWNLSLYFQFSSCQIRQWIILNGNKNFLTTALFSFKNNLASRIYNRAIS